MKIYWFIYETPEGGRIRVKAKRMPGPNTQPRSGTWVVSEWVERKQAQGFFTVTVGTWEMPCFPEITWGRLKQLKFIRKEEVCQLATHTAAKSK